jgi:nitrate/TMAO reductase-like tetraheme cytochrome c subunit
VPEKPRKSKSPILLDVHIPGAWIAGVLAAIVVLVVVAVVGFSAVNRIDTCGSCHVIKAEVATYKASAHYRAGVRCQQCHTKPGVFNYVIRNLEGVSNLVLYVSHKYQRPITTYVGADQCVQCHTNAQLDQDMVVGNIRVNHKGLRQAGYQCLDCHADVAHPGTRLEVARVSQNQMSICAKCHDGVKLSNKCDLCHIDGVPSSAPKVAMHVKIDPQQCAGCHKQKSFCARCHNGLPMPHPAGWTQSHGQVVIARGQNVCASCHLKKDKQFCIRCHGVVMPHPAGWQTGHGAKGLSDPSLCVKCHGQNSCIRCHGLTMPHPASWQATHGQVALSNQALCLKCHSNTSFCTACHGLTLPHSSSFIAGHPAYVPGHGGVCVKCHHNNGAGPNGCYGGDCHSGSIN